MEFFILLAVVFIITVIIGVSTSRKHSYQTNGSNRPTDAPANPQIPVYEDTPLPELLGIQPHLPLESAVIRLEQSLTGEFTELLKNRVQSKYPQMSNAEFKWKLLELKRYFLMTAVMRDVPMFSEPVDDLWHEMLMFTREYSRFGDEFLGSTIHHAPHTGGQSDPGGRAWFDWVYAQLFVQTVYSAQIWGPFFRFPLNRDFVEQLRFYNETELADSLFNKIAGRRYPEIRETILLLIHTAKEQAAHAVPGAVYTAERPAAGSAAFMPYLAGALMMYSLSDSSHFGSLMSQHYEEEDAQTRAQQHSSSSCGSGSDYGSGSLDDSHGNGNDGGSPSDGGSSSNGGSSCSSSSCSSGCGGGGGD